MLEIKEKLGEQLFNELFQTIITFYALNLLARTHNNKDFAKILDDVSVEEEGVA